MPPLWVVQQKIKRVEYQEKLSVEMQKMIEARAQEVYEERNGKQASEKEE